MMNGILQSRDFVLKGRIVPFEKYSELSVFEPGSEVLAAN
jgi:hypothetical protein